MRRTRQEPIALRLGQRIGALHLDRVLRRQHKERAGQRIGGAVDRHLALFHALQQSGLGFRRRPVDLVRDDDVGENRARPELELSGLPVVDADTR